MSSNRISAVKWYVQNVQNIPKGRVQNASITPYIILFIDDNLVYFTLQINAVPDTFIYSIVLFEDTIVGYGIIDKITGDIPQIAVNKHYRRKGIGRIIITELIKNTKSFGVGVLNVDEQSKSTKTGIKI